MSSTDGSSVTFRRPLPEASQRTIRRFARKLEREVAKGRRFDCLVSGDAELRKLNRDFRGKDYATDVLSFPGGNGHLGDLAISAARARAQAREFGHTTEDELRILMLHGVLHLMGHDHDIDRGRMARAEKRWRAKLGLPACLIERVQS